MHDVAAAAGVSVRTVSRVVNGGDNVKRDKLDRVLAAITDLGFRRNENARQLRQGTITTIGLMVEDVGDPFYALLTRAVEEVAVSYGFTLLTSSSAENPRRAAQVIGSFSGRGIAGLILAPPENLDLNVIRAELAVGCAIALVDRPLSGVDVDTVLADNRGGAKSGVNHLIERGHRNIAFVGDEPTLFTAFERHRGYVEACESAQLLVDPRLVRMEHPTMEAAVRVLDELFALENPPTALFSANNRWSVMLLRALRSTRKSIAFIGFDDFELSDVLVPDITVVAQDPVAMGAAAAELVFARLENLDKPTTLIELPTKLVLRGSA